jgi:hypothetical protein
MILAKVELAGRESPVRKETFAGQVTFVYTSFASYQLYRRARCA